MGVGLRDLQHVCTYGGGGLGGGECRAEHMGACRAEGPTAC